MTGQTLIEQVRRSLSEHCGVATGERAIVGLSGGVDSVVLVHILKEIGIDCQVVHVNYGIRGAESDNDEEFVADLCKRLDLPCRVVRPPAGWPAGASGSSLQESARDFRYMTFQDLAVEGGLTKVVVAHHLDDQVETVLLRMMRGTGLRGLVGMRPRRAISEGSDVELVRPLLSISRADILKWASDRSIQFREDRSNDDPAFDRARLRREVMPSIAEAFGEAGLRNVARSAAQAQAVYDAVVAQRLCDDLAAVTRAGDSPTLGIDALMEHTPGWRDMILLEAVRSWIPGAPERATIADKIAALATAQPGKKVIVADTVIWRGRGTITFVTDHARTSAVSVPDSSTCYELVPGKPVEIGSGTLIIDAAVTFDENNLSTLADANDPFTELVDEQVLQAAVSVGPWKHGEQFQPFGMEGSKNISDFLTDQKVEPHLKSAVPVVRSGDEVVWVVGHRLAKPFRVRPNSRRVLRLRFIPKT